MLKLGFLSHNMGLKFVALVIGFSTWIYVKSTEAVKVSNSFSVPLRVSSLSPNLEIVTLPKNVSVTVTGPIEQLGRVDMTQAQKELQAWVDLSHANSGVSDYLVDLSIPNELSRFSVTWERRVSVVTEAIESRESTVQVMTLNTVSQNLEYANAAVEPSTVLIQGNATKIRNIGTVRVMLDLSSIKPGETTDLKVEVLDVDQKPVADVKIVPEKVKVRPAFVSASPKRLAIVLPKFTGKPPAGFRLIDYAVEPYQVMVSGPNRLIQQISTVETEPIDIRQLKASGTKTVKLALPAQVRVNGGTDIQVKFKVRKVIDELDGASSPRRD